MTESLGKWSSVSEAKSAGSGHKKRIVCQSICKGFNKLQSGSYSHAAQIPGGVEGLGHIDGKYN